MGPTRVRLLENELARMRWGDRRVTIAGITVDLWRVTRTGARSSCPVSGPLTILSDVPREVGAGGLHSLAGRRIYVSRGVGVDRGQAPRLRLGAVPEVSLITLR